MFPLTLMDLLVTPGAARVDVVHLEFGRTSAPLAAPSVPLQHVLAQFSIGFGSSLNLDPAVRPNGADHQWRKEPPM